MKRPLVTCVIAFLIGEIFTLFLELENQWGVLVFSILCICILFKTKNISARCLIISIFFMICGFLLLRYRINGLEKQKYFYKEDMNIMGYVSLINEKDKSYMIKLEKCRNSKKDSYIGFDNNILLYIDKGKMDISIGDYIEVRGKISSFEHATNEGQFDEYKYYTEQMKYSYKFYEKEHHTLQRSKDNPKINRIKYYIKNYLYKIRDKLKKQIGKIYNNKNASIIMAMLLGEKSLMSSEIKSLYQGAGISHILAISSLHITIIGMGLYNFLNKCRVNIYLSSIISLLFLVLYAIMTDFSISTNRAVVMMIIMLLSKFFGRAYDVISSLCLSLLLVLVANPLLIQNTAFLLSFMAMVGIIVVEPILEKSLIGNNESIIKNSMGFYIDEKLGEFNDKNYIFSFSDAFNKLFKSIIQSLISGLCVQIVILPILVNTYFEINILSVFINIIVISLVPILLVTAIMAIISSFFSKSIGCFLGGSSHIILELYEILCNSINRINFLKVVVGYLEYYKIVYYYFVIMIVIYFMYYFAKKDILISKNIVWFIMFSWIIFVSVPNNNIKVSMLDVSQGDGMCITTKNNKAILIDGGSSDIKQVGKYRIEAFLKYNGLREIDYIFVSHMDDDHISGIIEILENSNYYVKNLVLPYRNKKDDKYNKLIDLAEKNNSKVKIIAGGEEMIIDGIRFICIHPLKEYISESENGQSMVLKMTYRNFDMLFTGDVEGDGEKNIEELLDKEDNIDVLKIAHHGSKNSSNTDFLNKIRPTYAIISAGKNNRYGHPHSETLDRLEQAKIKYYTTIDYGQIDIVTNGEKLLHIKNHRKEKK